MKTMTARELKNATGKVVRCLKLGESILLTFRGKPLGRIAPLGSQAEANPVVRPYEVAWADLEAQVRASRPRFATWQEAEDASRGRP